MKILAIHPIDEYRLQAISKQTIKYGEVALRGFYDKERDIFYLLEGCHRLEAAYRLRLPVTLLHCFLDTMVDVQFPKTAVDDKGVRILNKDGFANVEKLMQYICHSGLLYDESDFTSIKLEINESGSYS